ncbi:uncharacterized protein LOC133196297 [Saccostrea echinata]|uniref:uncharacterized protein LOC133196297 n=1 Tax=Saccostrea echinata TaxID=191078 RepID=UPI002A8077E6|nr:uncharacterized protein LOC133196297 [Saccostrea echinata]
MMESASNRTDLDMERVSMCFLWMALIQLYVICAIFATQLYLLIVVARRHLHPTPWTSVSAVGILYTLYYGYILFRLLSRDPTKCTDIYIPNLLCTALMLTLLFLVNRKEFNSVNNIIVVSFVSLSTLCLVLEYNIMDNTNGRLEQSALFCRSARDMLPIFAQEYFTLDLPLLVIGLIQRSDVCSSCIECRQWEKIQSDLLRLFSCVLLILRPLQIYYLATLDFQYSDIFLSYANLMAFVYVYIKSIKVSSKDSAVATQEILGILPSYWKVGK